MPTASQVEMNFAAPDPAAVASQKDVERVVSILSDAGQLTAAEICLKWGLKPSENNKRKVRAVARASWPGIVSFVGGDGFKLLRQCSLDEAWAAVRALENQDRDAVIKKRLLLDAIHTGKVGAVLPFPCQAATGRQDPAK